MNKPVIAGVAIAALGIIAAVAIAARYGVANIGGGPEYAQVVSVQPVKQTTSNPHQVCGDQTVVHREPYRDQHQIGGTAIGAVAGALLGHQIGGGKGKDLATVGGAVAGGFAGHEIQKRHQENNATYTTVE
ncbi:MAG: glycine zipper 2TM domain-containing protein, partial [Rhodanobacteraceae bacterium]